MKAVFGVLGTGEGLTGQRWAAFISRRDWLLGPCTKGKEKVWIKISPLAEFSFQVIPLFICTLRLFKVHFLFPDVLKKTVQ